MASATKRAREELVERHLPLADEIARRYKDTKEPLDDLVQVARVGLIKAAARWDPARGSVFSAYAVPTMVGELRRYFRDAAWAVRPPRDLQELSLAAERVGEQLVQELGREPSAGEVASWLGRDVEDVLEALEAGLAYTIRSLDVPIQPGETDGAVAGELVVDSRDALERAEDATPIAQLGAELGSPDREIVRLRYAEDLVQREIGERVGCSQMHVSRRLRVAVHRDDQGPRRMDIDRTVPCSQPDSALVVRSSSPRIRTICAKSSVFVPARPAPLFNAAAGMPRCDGLQQQDQRDDDHDRGDEGEHRDRRRAPARRVVGTMRLPVGRYGGHDRSPRVARGHSRSWRAEPAHSMGAARHSAPTRGAVPSTCLLRGAGCAAGARRECARARRARLQHLEHAHVQRLDDAEAARVAATLGTTGAAARIVSRAA
jgi:RNA polymerase sigma-B factor